MDKAFWDTMRWDYFRWDVYRPDWERLLQQFQGLSAKSGPIDAAFWDSMRWGMSLDEDGAYYDECEFDYCYYDIYERFTGFRWDVYVPLFDQLKKRMK